MAFSARVGIGAVEGTEAMEAAGAVAAVAAVAAMEGTEPAESFAHTEGREVAEGRAVREVTCVVRCLEGEVSPGTVFDTVTSPGGDTAPVALRVAAVRRYGREAALLDPPHAAKLDLVGEGARALRTGDRLSARGG